MQEPTQVVRFPLESSLSDLFSQLENVVFTLEDENEYLKKLIASQAAWYESQLTAYRREKKQLSRLRPFEEQTRDLKRKLTKARSISKANLQAKYDAEQKVLPLIRAKNQLEKRNLFLEKKQQSNREVSAAKGRRIARLEAEVAQLRQVPAANSQFKADEMVGGLLNLAATERLAAQISQLENELAAKNAQVAEYRTAAEDLIVRFAVIGHD